MVSQGLAINGQQLSFDVTGGNSLRRGLWGSVLDNSFGVSLHVTSKVDETQVSELDEIEGDYLSCDCKDREVGRGALS